MSDFDVTIAVTAHGEGPLLVPALASAAQAAQYAQATLGASVELLIMLDRADALTRQVAEAWSEPVRVARTDFGDPGLARNKAASLARGRFIAFLDGDDLCGANWISSALDHARRDRREIVWHPQVNLFFGAQPAIFVHVDMEAPGFDPASLALTNCWTALAFSRTEFVRAVPYPASEPGLNHGFEDWAWNILAIEAGALHKVVPATGHAIRVKPKGSVLARAAASGAIAPPTLFFRSLLKA